VNRQPLPTPPFPASGGGAAPGVFAEGGSATRIEVAMTATEPATAPDAEPQEFDAAPAAQGRLRIRRRRPGMRTSRRGAFARFVRDALADGLRGAEGRIRPRPSNEGQS
jgi:hypothetical protein